MVLPVLIPLGLLPIALLGGCRSVQPPDPRIPRAEAASRSEAWVVAASVWGEIYRDSRGQNREAGIESAEALGHVGQPGVARSRLAEMARTWPEDAELQELLGKAHETQGDVAGAIEAYGAAVALDPARVGSVARLAVLGKEVPGPGGALGQLRAAGRLRSVDPQSLHELGLRAAGAERFDDAFDALDLAVGSGELSLPQRVGAAAALVPDPRVIPWLTAVVREDPLHTEALTLLGTVQMAAGFQRRALGTLEQAASSDPSHEPTLRALADALIQAGQLGRAEEILTLLGEELPQPEPELDTEAGPELDPAMDPAIDAATDPESSARRAAGTQPAAADAPSEEAELTPDGV